MTITDYFKERDEWFHKEITKLSAEYDTRTRSIYVRNGIAKNRLEMRPFQTPLASIASSELKSNN